MKESWGMCGFCPNQNCLSVCPAAAPAELPAAPAGGLPVWVRVPKSKLSVAVCLVCLLHFQHFQLACPCAALGSCLLPPSPRMLGQVRSVFTLGGRHVICSPIGKHHPLFWGGEAIRGPRKCVVASAMKGYDEALQAPLRCLTGYSFPCTAGNRRPRAAGQRRQQRRGVRGSVC